ncbi:MAG: hypothetical protein KF900_02515 [Bacteroidetes bacterium]|nr:hypothetical protein [Bacteroidota bacterium]
MKIKIHSKKLCALCASVVIFPFFSFAQTQKKNNGNRVHFGPAIGFYTINKNHAASPTQRMSALIGYSREIMLGNSFKTFFLFGADYFAHGLNFRSYYFEPGNIHVYNKSFDYTYSLFIHELNIPVQFKYLFKRENNSIRSPYISVGYSLRYLLPFSILKVSQNGNVSASDANLDLKFRTPLFYSKLNSFITAAVGWQRNSIRKSGFLNFYVELNVRYGFSSYYFEKEYAASSLYINALQTSLQLGFKF